jgi:hypothetical protein
LGDISPDVLTLHSDNEEPHDSSPADSNGGMIAVAEQPPQVSLSLEATSETAFYLNKRRTLVIRHATGDRIVALIEIVSPGNKHSTLTVEAFLDKALAALRDGYHLLLIDLFPPGSFDPQGMLGVVWEHLAKESWEATSEQPLTLASYCAKSPVTTYVEPMQCGRTLPDMPLFLKTSHYINVPLEQTYAAYRGVPQRWRKVIEA